MKRGLILLLVLTVIISGCTALNQPDQQTCEKPYISAGGSCCLDQNDNGICDNGEGSTEELESSTASNGAVEVICPNVKFNVNEASREIEFEVKQVASGSSNYAPTLKCDGSYKSLTLQRFILNQGESQKFKNTIYPSNIECEFGVVETANTERAVYCKTKIIKS